MPFELNIPAELAASYADVESALREQGAGYSPLELVATRLECAKQDLAAEERWVCLKVPSGSEVDLEPALVRHLILELRRQWRSIG